jgi:hypothetical protein
LESVAAPNVAVLRARDRTSAWVFMGDILSVLKPLGEIVGCSPMFVRRK